MVLRYGIDQKPWNQIKGQIETTTLLIMTKKKLQERLAKLAGGVAVLYVGAFASPNRNEKKKDRVDDVYTPLPCHCRRSCIVGGGVALLRAKRF